MPTSRRLGALSLVVLLVGCTHETASGPVAEAAVPGEEPIRTDRSLYVLEEGTAGWETEIRFDYTNRSDRTISIANCHEGFSLRLEKRQGGEWAPAWSPPVLLCLSSPIEIRPGRTYSRRLRVFGGYPDNESHPKFEVDELDGTYRLVVEAAYWRYDHGGPPWGQQVPLEHRVSGDFEIAAG